MLVDIELTELKWHCAHVLFFFLIYAHVNAFVSLQGPTGLAGVLAPMPVVMQPHHRLYHYNNTSQPSKG